MACILVPLFTHLLSVGLLHGAELRVILGERTVQLCSPKACQVLFSDPEHRQLLKYHTQQVRPLGLPIRLGEDDVRKHIRNGNVKR